ncbi:MAG: DUF2358 domain-containing protein [Cyanobacteria bacterium J06642_11]
MESSQDTTLSAVIAQVKADYGRFPVNQTYELYSENVYFKDPMNEFRGVERYQRMIGFIQQWFRDIELELTAVEQPEDTVAITRWVLHFTAPTPWQPRISIPGWSELTINGDGLICSHIDYWNCSRWDVVQQLFRFS